jgi:hypothetical protein
MDDKEKKPPEERKPSSVGKKLHLDLSEAMIKDIDDDDDIIELKDEVSLSSKEEAEIDLNDDRSPGFSQKSSKDNLADETLIDFEDLSIEFGGSQNNTQEGGDLLFEEEEEEENDAEISPRAAEHSLKADGTNEVMEITEFDDILSENDNGMITLIEDREEPEPEDEFLELIEVEDDRSPEASNERIDEKIEEEIIQFDDPDADIEDIELESFINESLDEEIQIGDELEDDLIHSLGAEAEPEISLADQTTESEEFNFNMDTTAISEKIDRLDTIFFDDTQAESEDNDAPASENEDRNAEAENEDIRIADEDVPAQPPTVVTPPDFGANPDQIEQSIERFIEQNYSEKIESMITAIIEKAVAKEINRLKTALLGDDSTEDL